MSAMQPQPAMHPEGQHNFPERVDGVWTCPCGEKRDKGGKPIRPRHLKVVGK